MRNVNLFQIVAVWFLGSSVNSVLGQATDFDIVRGDLVFFRTEVENRPVSVNQDFGSRQTSSDFTYSSSDRSRPHHKHYQKGNVRTNVRESDTDKNANRQGRNCPGVCRYIPDRDTCPTNVIEELEADDEDYDEDYSEENSIEESESEDEEYSDKDEDDYYSDEDNEVRRTQPKMKSGGKKKGGQKHNQAKTLKPVYGPPGKNIHIVYPPVTRFAATKNTKNKLNTTETRGQLKISMRSKSATKNRQRQRRNKVKSQESKDVKLRAPALEQEIILRWDRVVERGPFIGGDIVLPEGVLLRPPNFRSQKKRWPDGVIPYLMDSSINSCRQNAILDAMDEIEDKTCIRFAERKSERNYIDIRRSTVGCSSYVGMVGGAQVLNLSTGCFSKFTVTHELIHAIGFDHEQSRKDRDKYIEVDFDNVLQRKDVQFELNPSFTGDGFPYDIRSIMHYSAFLFAKDKCEPTIYPVNEKIDLCALGAGDGKGGMTNCDAAKINKMYKCGKQYSQKCKV